MVGYARIVGIVFVFAGCYFLLPAAIAVAVAAAQGFVGSALVGLVVNSLQILLGGAFILLGLRAFRAPPDSPAPLGEPKPEPKDAPLPPPVDPVPEAAVDDLPVPLHACPRCGGLDIRPAGVSDGVWPGGGELIYQVCRRCSFRGQPFRFEEASDYAAFVADLHETRAEPA